MMKKIYCNGEIITMAKSGEWKKSEAVATENGIITATGTFEELKSFAPKSEIVDLGGATLMPAFIDAHSHFSAFASSFLQVSLDECKSFDEIGEKIKDFIDKNNLKLGEWIIAKGFDHNSLKEKRPPDLASADSWAQQYPLVISHASGHSGVFNSLACNQLGIKQSDFAEVSGYLEESNYFNFIEKVPTADEKKMAQAYQKAQRAYASYGIVSVQEGMAVSAMIPLYRGMLANGSLYIDVTGYCPPEDSEKFKEAFPESVNKFDRHFRLGGYKIFLDGSPQSRTAWMRTPYKGGEKPYFGNGTKSNEEVTAAVEKAGRDNMQILAHCNGDAAAQQFIDAVAKVSEKYDMKALRPVMIHAQLVGTDQLDEIKRLGIILSFFVAHVYHWGDVHIENFGLERASRISPVNSADKKGIVYTFHQDTPVINPNMLETVWCAADRITKNGILLGGDERISVGKALEAVTANAAYQYFDEKSTGTIEQGKKADFVILSQNPLNCGMEEIRKIKVLKTIKNDNVIFEL